MSKSCLDCLDATFGLPDHQNGLSGCQNVSPENQIWPSCRHMRTPWQGNVFLNGIHVSYFNLQFGECFAPPGGVNPHGSCDTYIRARCDKPTQDCYHVPPSWISDQNELLVWNEATLPANVTDINPNLAAVVYRVDPPDVLRAIAPFLF